MLTFTETKLPGVFTIDVDAISDHRGFFATPWTRHDFIVRDLNADFVQTNQSFNHAKGTLRGLHSRIAPYQEEKLVRCIEGALYDVVVDGREDSPTYRQWVAVELTARNMRMVYIPKGCFHGFQTLVDNTMVQYQVSQPYVPQAEIGWRYDDPALGIHWPIESPILSDKDTQWPLLLEQPTTV